MTAITPEALAPPARTGVAERVWRFVKRHALTVYAILAVGYLMLPIAVVILFSFNAPEGRFNYVWQGFTLDHWINWNSILGIQDAVITSLEVGLLATVVATVLGTLHRARDRAPPVRRAARRRTSSSSCRWRRPRSSSAPRC